ncbi:HIT domain-containing protein [Methylobacterium sp. J-090]|uniref:HIT domain-containing protein n=1 Tax=Methylobacterium sp. J-090 TaxID=2836666 RepID=UPI001FBB85B6|nr:HIT domain-containing protein [Methylobacterium sp. J-090]MCJ2080273.1 HIT domain-containing protein [Methylobacterium sp. J-090]
MSTTADFTLDPRLAADTVHAGDLALCRVLLMDDARFPWLILVPRRPDVSEITDLSPDDARSLMDEMRLASGVMLALAKPDKVNVAALGNVVPQLHVHVIGRFLSDPAWPRPVWGVGDAKPYPAHARAQMIERIGALFAAA